MRRRFFAVPIAFCLLVALTLSIVTAPTAFAAAAPTVTAISPATGSTAGGTVVTVTGTNLTGATKAAFGGTAGTTLTVVSATQVKITSPAHAAGAVDVQVTTAGGTSAVATADKFTYAAPPAAPTVTAISPATGSTAGGTVVTVTGTNLTGATKAAFGGTAGTTLTVVSATQVKITSPAHAAGAVDVQVTTAGGTSAVATADKFTYAAPPAAPTVTAISPATGSTAGGTVVTVTGTNLTGATKAAFGGTAGTTLTVVSATQVKITSPAHAAGAVDVQVTTAGGTSAVATADKFTYAAPPAAPTVTAISPATGSTAGGTVVTVTGTNLTGATKAAFGGTAGTTLTVVSATQVKITSPAHAAGAVDVQVTTAGGTSAVATADKFTYAAPPAAPTVTAISPATGSTAGGTVVTVTGTNLTGATKAAFGGTAGTTLTVVSATQVKITSPAHAAGAVDVQVTTAGGTSAVATADKFTYAAPPAAPTVTAISPATGSTAGGTVVTVTGTNLTGATKAAFGGTAGTTLTVVSATQVKITSPAHAAGAVDVQVTTAGGTSAVATADKFTYAAPPAAPTVTAISPATGSTAGGTVVTVTGTNLTGATKAAFGGTAGTTLTVVSATQVKITSPAHAAGAVDVQVTTAGGTSAVATADKFTYAAPCSVVHVSGTLAGNAAWTPTCVAAYVLDGNVDVPAGITLSIAAGTLVKSSANAVLSVEGSLVVAGTAASPVTFTSVRDDSIGGDTNGDGNTTSPVAGDWSGISVSGTTSTVSLGHVDIRYAYVGVSSSGAVTASITNSTVQHSAGYGIQVSDSGWPSATNQLASAVVTGNTVTGSGSIPIDIADYNHGLSLTVANLQGNAGSGNAGGNFMQLDYWQLVKSETWGFGAGAMQVVLTGGTDVPDGDTLTIPAGNIVKFGNPYYSSLTVEGSLVVAGTAASPVTFTSVRDDSIGGDTNGDGNTTSPVAGDWSGISVSGTTSTVSLGHVDIRYAYVGVSSSGAVTASITNSTVQHSAGYGIQVSDSGWPSATNQLASAVVTGNTVTGSGSIPIDIADYNHGLSLTVANLQGNAGSGNAGGNFMQLDYWQLVKSETWGFGAGAMQVVLTGGTDVPAGDTLTIPAGNIVKFGNPYYSSLTVEGSLVVAGTAASPVTFTSVRDDSIGGDTNGDGNTTSPVAGDWSGISVSGTTSTVSLGHVDIRYAYVGVSSSGAVTASITNSTVQHSAGYGIQVSDSGWPSATNQLASAVVTGNTVTGSGSIPIDIADYNHGLSLTVANLQGNAGSGNAGGNFMQLDYWQLVKSETWGFGAGAMQVVLTGGTDVPAGDTLTIPAGNIVKFGNPYYSSLTVEGSLVVAGTAASPVTFTSVRDDSIGGDTNGDGNTTSPVAGDWSGISVSGTTSTVSLGHVDIRYAYVGVSSSGAVTASITNSTVQHSAGYGIQVSDSGWPSATNQLASAVVTGNTVTGSGSIPIDIADYNHGLSLTVANLQGNAGSGNAGGNFMQLDYWQLVKSETWGFGAGAMQVVLTGGTDVPAGDTLTIPAGNIVKFGNPYYSSLTVEGSLVVAGTAASPVTFTSVRDDSIGGDTNGDGNTTSPVAGDWSGISVSGTTSTVSLGHVDIRYAYVGVSSSGAVTASITNSTVQHSAGYGIQVSDSGWPSATNQLASAVVTGNTVTGSGSIPIDIADYNHGLSLTVANLQGNAGSGNAGGNFMQLDYWQLVKSETWGFGAGAMQVVLTGGTDVPAGDTLTIPAGNIVKFGNPYYSSLTVEGSLVVAGTAASPVTFTSVRDDSIGGDTNGDGNTTSPVAGDWSGITVGSIGTAVLQGSTLQYALTALSVADGGNAEIHGKILKSALGVSSNFYVDATGVDWGDPSGPAPMGTGTPIAGAGVDVLPWVGWVAPPLPPAAPAGTSPDTPATGSSDVPAGCRRVMFLAVRGSGEPTSNGTQDSADDSAYSNWLDGFGPNIWTVYGGFEEYMRSHGYSDSDWKGIGLRYRAMHVPVVENALGGAFSAALADASYNASIWQGVDRIEQYLNDEYTRCHGTQKYVLAGYSQGALAIHIYLTRRAPANIRSLIAAVGLQADPAKNKNGAEAIYTNSWTNARNSDQGIVNATGIYSKVQLPGSGSIPSDVTGRTVTLCHNNDIVCAPGWGSSASNHTNYTNDELVDLGAWLADTAISSGLPPR